MAESSNDKGALVATIFGEAAETYNLSPFFPPCGERLSELANVSPGARVLDVATGRGAVLFPLVRRVGPEGSVVGIDVAEAMVARTLAATQNEGLRNVTVRQMNAETLDFEDSSFDCATCGFALWFIPRLAQALAEMRRVLRPGGRLAVSTWGPQNEINKRYTELINGLGARWQGLDSHTLTTASAVRDVLADAGFDVAYAEQEPVSVDFANEESWWAQRMNLAVQREERLPVEVRPRFKQEIFEALQKVRQPDGAIRDARTAIFAVGVK